MKRALGLVLIIVACVIGFLSIRGAMPFMPIFGGSMEPVFKAGDLILIEEISPSEVKEGDIVVYNVPQIIQDTYNYPPIVAHRVITVHASETGVSFRTKGDNTGEDPFTVRAQDIKGTVSQQIPYLGFPLLFFQSHQGLTFIIIALCLLALYLYGGELSLGTKRVQRGIFSPIIEENRRSSQVMAQRMESNDKRMEGTQQALEKFSSAIELYAQHLQSHTTAIQGLSEASQELKKGAIDQNIVLRRLMEVMEQGVVKGEEVMPRVEQVVPRVKEIKFPPGCIKSRQKPAGEERIFRAG